MKRILLSAAFFAGTFLAIQPVFSYNIHLRVPSLKTSTDKELSIVPDRATGEMKVRFTAEKAASAILEVMDESGKLVLQQTAQLTSGINNVCIVNSLKLKEGVYTLRFVTNNVTYSSRFLIWK